MYDKSFEDFFRIVGVDLTISFLHLSEEIKGSHMEYVEENFATELLDFLMEEEIIQWIPRHPSQLGEEWTLGGTLPIIKRKELTHLLEYVKRCESLLTTNGIGLPVIEE